MCQAVRFLVCSLAIASLAPLARANSLSLGDTSAFQQNGFKSVDLVTHASVTLSPSSYSTLTQLSFFVPITGVVPAGVGGSLVISSTVLGMTFTQSLIIPSGTYPPPGHTGFNELFQINYPAGLSSATPVTLSLKVFDGNGNLLNSSNYSFKFIEAVPEPGTLVLFGTGLVAIATRKRRRKPLGARL